MVKMTPLSEAPREQDKRHEKPVLQYSTAWRTSALCVLVSALVLWLWSVVEQIIPNALLTSATILIPDLVIAVGIASLLTIILRFTFGRHHVLSLSYIWSTVMALVLLLTMRAGATQLGWHTTALLSVVCASIIGGYIGLLCSRGLQHMTRRPRRVGTASFALAILLVGAAAIWFAAPGTTAKSVADASMRSDAQRIIPLATTDPSKPGDYPVGFLTYGSGNDRQRPEYNKGISIKTQSVDSSKIISGWSGSSGTARTQLWGFDEKNLPINGRVWYPQGSGKFPLVLIVHGNNNSATFSDPGYEYIGRQLASQGFIAASVDENFLNTGLIDKSGGLSGAGAARGWLILEHLRDWTSWDTQVDNPFYQKIDTNNIALIGHSRGGEAVAIAADFNKRSSYPENSSLKFDYSYAIKSVMAISPAEGQYKPSGKGVAFNDVNYLTLQGSYDADVTSFGGLNQYERISETSGSDYFKSALYIDRADHDQFNTVWGKYDVGKGLAKRFLNTKAMLTANEQQKIAQVYSSAFMMATLKDRTEYRPLLQDYRVGSAWLPKTIYQNQYSDAKATYAVTNQNTNSLTSTSLPGATISLSGFTQSSQQPLMLRAGVGENRVARLQWDTNSTKPARYMVTMPTGAVITDDQSHVHFDMADATTSTDSATSLTIEVSDTDGHTARLPLKQDMPLQSPLRNSYLKPGLPTVGSPTEPVLQTYSIALNDFKNPESGFDPIKLSSIAFVFDQTPTGAVLLDNIGLPFD